MDETNSNTPSESQQQSSRFTPNRKFVVATIVMLGISIATVAAVFNASTVGASAITITMPPIDVGLPPTRYPTPGFPTLAPTKFPTSSPTASPTKFPTTPPTASPTKSPTLAPTKFPTTSPTASPTKSPTNSPTPSPSYSPSLLPTASPFQSSNTTKVFPEEAEESLSNQQQDQGGMFWNIWVSIGVGIVLVVGFLTVIGMQVNERNKIALALRALNRRERDRFTVDPPSPMVSRVASQFSDGESFSKNPVEGQGLSQDNPLFEGSDV